MADLLNFREEPSRGESVAKEGTVTTDHVMRLLGVILAQSYRAQGARHDDPKVFALANGFESAIQREIPRGVAAEDERRLGSILGRYIADPLSLSGWFAIADEAAMDTNTADLLLRYWELRHPNPFHFVIERIRIGDSPSELLSSEFFRHGR